MIPWVELGRTQMPGGGGELRLMQRGAEFSIMSGAIELMNSRVKGSEEALATLAWERLEGRPGFHGMAHCRLVPANGAMRGRHALLSTTCRWIKREPPSLDVRHVPLRSAAKPEVRT